MTPYLQRILPVFWVVLVASCLQPEPIREPPIVEHQGESICFFSQETTASVTVSMSTCLSSSCTRAVEQKGTLLIDQNQLLIKGTSIFTVQDLSIPNGACTADCGGGGSIVIEVNDLAEGIYEVHLDEQHYGSVTLPLYWPASVCLSGPVIATSEATPKPASVSPLPTQDASDSSATSRYTPDSPLPTPVRTDNAVIATPTAIPFPTITPAPWHVDLVSSPECTTDGQKTQCTDSLLHISFEYPSSWGEITSYLQQGLVGYEYDYEFVEPGTERRTIAIAGGLSSNYFNQVGGDITYFKGFSEFTAEEYCQVPHREFCVVVRPSIALEIRFPDDKAICDFYPGYHSYPLGSVLVDLPIPRLINGFIFHIHILSDEQKAELYSLLGEIEEHDDYPFPNRPPSDCSPEARAAFNAKRIEMIEEFKTGMMDAGTRENIQALYDLAKSITGPALNVAEEQ